MHIFLGKNVFPPKVDWAPKPMIPTLKLSTTTVRILYVLVQLLLAGHCDIRQWHQKKILKNASRREWEWDRYVGLHTEDKTAEFNGVLTVRIWTSQNDKTDLLTWWSMFGLSASWENVCVMRNRSSMPSPSAKNGSIFTLHTHFSTLLQDRILQVRLRQVRPVLEVLGTVRIPRVTRWRNG